MSGNGVAVVDLGAVHGDGAALAEGLRDTGFVRLVGHGVPDARIERARQLFARFFALPEAARLGCLSDAGGARGYTPFGIEHARDRSEPDPKEFFHVGRERDRTEGLPPNRWPAELPELRDAACALFDALEACAARLLLALERPLGLAPGTLSDMVRGGNHVLRALHYPPLEAGAPAGALRAAPHEDINLVTLLPSASAPGLEILDREGRWCPVASQPGEIVADAGDMLARVTNDAIPATTHRVVAEPGGADARRGRYAMPFFAHPRPEVDLSVLPSFTGPDRPARHAPITAGAFLEQRLREIGLLDGT